MDVFRFLLGTSIEGHATGHFRLINASFTGHRHPYDKKQMASRTIQDRLVMYLRYLT